MIERRCRPCLLQQPAAAFIIGEPGQEFGLRRVLARLAYYRRNIPMAPLRVEQTAAVPKYTRRRWCGRRRGVS